MKNIVRINFVLGLLCIIPFYSFKNKDCKSSSFPEEIYKELPFKMKKVKRPEFPDLKVSIADFGAKNDGVTSNTTAFAKAIDFVSGKGGGMVVVPEGLWLTGPVELKSNVNLYTESGAVVLFTRNYDEYPLIRTSYEGEPSWRVKSPLFANNAKNIAITGHGIFDGNGDAWRPVKKNNVTGYQWRDFVKSGGYLNENKDVWYPTKKALAGSTDKVNHDMRSYENALAVKEWLRPVLFNFIRCENILVEGVSFRNSPAWCLHPLMCRNIIFSGVNVKNEEWAANGDAIDVESCKNVILYKCNFDAGDDGICMKSGKNESGRKRGMPTENVIIYDCNVYNGHGGFVVGSEMSGGVRNVFLKKCCFIGTDNGLRFKSTRGRGGIVEDIYISDVYMVNIKRNAILYNMYYAVKEDGKVHKADEGTPQFRDIYMKNIVCKGAGQAVLFHGLPEMKLRRIYLENSVIDANKGIECIDAEDITMKNVNVISKETPVIDTVRCKRILVD